MEKKTEIPSVDAFIEDELEEYNPKDPSEKIVKSLLKVPYKDHQGKDKALRVLLLSEQGMLYASTRLGTLYTSEDGYQVNVTRYETENLLGKKYELRDAGSGKLLQQGKISTKGVAANIIDLPAGQASLPAEQAGFPKSGTAKR